MRWFFHRCRGPRSRGRLPNKMPHFFVFLPRWPWLLTLTFERWRDFCRMHVTAMFHHPTFNCSEVTVLTNKQTNWQTNRRRWKHPPRSATYAGG